MKQSGTLETLAKADKAPYHPPRLESTDIARTEAGMVQLQEQGGFTS